MHGKYISYMDTIKNIIKDCTGILDKGEPLVSTAYYNEYENYHYIDINPGASFRKVIDELIKKSYENKVNYIFKFNDMVFTIHHYLSVDENMENIQKNI
jgi:hypothetical protein